MVAFACIYALVALGLLAYSRVSGGPWTGWADFGLDVLFCVWWPLSLSVLAFDCLVRAAERCLGRRL